MILKPKPRLVLFDLVRVTFKFLFACLCVGLLLAYQGNIFWPIAGVLITIVLYLFACALTVRLESSSRPWLEVSAKGVTDSTPLGLGDIQWSDIQSASFYRGREKRLGLELVDVDRVLFRQPVWKRRLLAIDRWLSNEPPVRFQQRAFTTSLETLREELASLNSHVSSLG